MEESVGDMESLGTLPEDVEEQKSRRKRR